MGGYKLNESLVSVLLVSAFKTSFSKVLVPARLDRDSQVNLFVVAQSMFSTDTTRVHIKT